MTPQEQTLSVCRYCGPQCPIPYGYCHCGCEKKVRIASRGLSRLRHIKGQPVRYIIGHHSTSERPDTTNENPFEIEGVVCRRVPLTQGMWAIVFEFAYEWAMQWRWYAKESDGSYYAARNIPRRERATKFKTIYMHRAILGLEPGDPKEGDHKNRDSLDNRHSNLRRATREENSRNLSLRSNNKSGRTGVSWSGEKQQWHVAIGVKGKTVYLGCYDDFNLACSIREAAEQFYFGEFSPNMQ
jgi:hypothetical protein